MPPDPRPAARVRDPQLLRDLHARWTVCAFCYWVSEGRWGIADHAYGLSLHHIHKHPRDDVEANLIMVCGDGVSGHHGRVEAHDPTAMRVLVRYLRTMRPDTFEYLTGKLGSAVAADDWLTRLAIHKPIRRHVSA